MKYYKSESFKQLRKLDTQLHNVYSIVLLLMHFLYGILKACALLVRLHSTKDHLTKWSAVIRFCSEGTDIPNINHNSK